MLKMGKYIIPCLPEVFRWGRKFLLCLKREGGKACEEERLSLSVVNELK